MKNTKERFDQLADTGVWPSRYDPSDVQNYNFIARRDSVSELIGQDRFSSTLDIGCGTGDYCDLLAGVSAEYVGIDFSPTMIQRATVAHGGPGRVFMEGSAEALSFADNHFDLVCAIGFIEYFSDPVAPMREIVRVLKPGGVLIIQSFQRDVFKRMSTATGLDVVKRTAKLAYSLISRTPVPTGFSTDTPYFEEELDALMRRFGFVKQAHRNSNYHLLPKTLRRILPHANARASRAVTPHQPDVLRRFAVNYVGRYRLSGK